MTSTCYCILALCPAEHHEQPHSIDQLFSSTAAALLYRDRTQMSVSIQIVFFQTTIVKLLSNQLANRDRLGISAHKRTSSTAMSSMYSQYHLSTLHKRFKTRQSTTQCFLFSLPLLNLSHHPPKLYNLSLIPIPPPAIASLSISSPLTIYYLSICRSMYSVSFRPIQAHERADPSTAKHSPPHQPISAPRMNSPASSYTLIDHAVRRVRHCLECSYAWVSCLTAGSSHANVWGFVGRRCASAMIRVHSWWIYDDGEGSRRWKCNAPRGEPCVWFLPFASSLLRCSLPVREKQREMLRWMGLMCGQAPPYRNRMGITNSSPHAVLQPATHANNHTREFTREKKYHRPNR